MYARALDQGLYPSNRQLAAAVGRDLGDNGKALALARLPQAVGAAVAFYGAQSIDFDDATADYQGHYAELDHIVSEEDRVVTESFIRLGGRHTEFHLYPGTHHWFFEEGDTFDADAAGLAWDRTRQFLADHLGATAGVA